MGATNGTSGGGSSAAGPGGGSGVNAGGAGGAGGGGGGGGHGVATAFNPSFNPAGTTVDGFCGTVGTLRNFEGRKS